MTTLAVGASAPNHRHSQIRVDVLASTTLVALNDITLYQPGPVRDMVGGGLAIVRAPSRWQKLKRRLFN